MKIDSIGDEKDLDDYEQINEASVHVPQSRLRGPTVAPPLALDSRMWLNMVHVKPPNIADLEIESIQKFILDYKKYAQKYLRQLLRNMKQIILDERQI